MYKLPPVKPMSEQQIRHEAHQLSLKFLAEVGPEHVLRRGMNFDELYDAVLYPEYEIEFVKEENLGVDDDGVRIMGEFLPKYNTALVDKKLFDCNDPRRVFTECHEVIGHGVLHGPFLRDNARKYPKLYSTEDVIGLGSSGFSWKQMNTFEWQANVFAANVIAPPTYVWCVLLKLFGLRSKIRFCGPRWYSLSFNEMNWPVYAASPFNLAWIIAKRIRHYFGGLSSECLAYQVLRVGIDQNGYDQGGLRSNGTVPTVGNILREMMHD